MAVGDQPVVFVLASASAGRAGTLRRAGIEPLIVVSQVDEDVITDRYRVVGPDSAVPAAAASELVVELARAKAHAVLDQLCVESVRAHAHQWFSSVPTGGAGESPSCALEALVVGCDSMLASAGRLVGKPHDAQSARERIAEQSGRTVVLHTGHCVLRVAFGRDGALQVRERAQAAQTQVHFGQLSPVEIDAYVDTGEPLEVAGAFTIDGLGGAFIDGVSGDPHSVVGISLPLVRQLASQLDVAWPRLWTR